MSSLTIKNLNKIYNPGKNEVHAVKDFNLEIEDGEFVALLGPSGCGKTSTLRMIVGLESITSGSILFDDVEINHLSPEQRNVAMAFESYALYPNFTIFENLAFPLEVKKALINSNFTYNIYEEEREKWLLDITQVLTEHNIDYSISQHPRDRGDLSCYGDKVLLSNSSSIVEQIAKSDIVITRFSSLIHESLTQKKKVRENNGQFR